MSISTNPSNQNLAQGSKFLLSFERLPTLTFFCLSAGIPGVSVNQATQHNPLVDAPVPGNKMIYESFNIKFLIDEELLSWTSVLDWMKGYSFPETTDQYKNLSLQQKLLMNIQKPQYSDAVLTIYSNKNNPLLQVKFVDIFPITLSSIDFDTSLTAQNILTATASFVYTNYTINRL